MFQNFFKKRKIKKYARKLPQDLKENYLYQKYYSKEPVDASIKRKRIGAAVTDNCYAYAMHCSHKEFDDIHEDTRETCDYEAMRGEISDTMFNGASDFLFSTLLVESANAESSSVVISSDSSFGGSDGGFS